MQLMCVEGFRRLGGSLGKSMPIKGKESKTGHRDKTNYSVILT